MWTRAAACEKNLLRGVIRKSGSSLLGAVSAKSIQPDKQPGLIATFKCNHIPWTIDKRTGESFHRLPLSIEHDQAAGLGRCRCAIRRRQTAQPERKTTRAVVSPTPPGHDNFVSSIWAKRLTVPSDATSTMVDPVPCWFWKLLKLLTRMCPVDYRSQCCMRQDPG